MIMNQICKLSQSPYIKDEVCVCPLEVGLGAKLWCIVDTGDDSKVEDRVFFGVITSRKKVMRPTNFKNFFLFLQ